MAGIGSTGTASVGSDCFWIGAGPGTCARTSTAAAVMQTTLHNRFFAGCLIPCSPFLSFPGQINYKVRYANCHEAEADPLNTAWNLQLRVFRGGDEHRKGHVRAHPHRDPDEA